MQVTTLSFSHCLQKRMESTRRIDCYLSHTNKACPSDGVTYSVKAEKCLRTHSGGSKKKANNQQPISPLTLILFIVVDVVVVCSNKQIIWQRSCAVFSFVFFFIPSIKGLTCYIQLLYFHLPLKTKEYVPRDECCAKLNVRQKKVSNQNDNDTKRKVVPLQTNKTTKPKHSNKKTKK